MSTVSFTYMENYDGYNVIAMSQNGIDYYLDFSQTITISPLQFGRFAIEYGLDPYSFGTYFVDMTNQQPDPFGMGSIDVPTDRYDWSVSMDLSDRTASLMLVGSLRGDVLRGGSANDTLWGDNGNDLIEGGRGSNNLDGGNGTDTVSYEHATAGALVNLGAGRASWGSADDTFVHFENVLGSAYEDTLVGDAGANLIQGKDGDDFLDGGAGADRLVGGSGDDTFVVDDAGDLLYETADAGSGTDAVESSVTYKLRANIENLTLTGTGDINGTGNDATNTLTGNDGDNTLDGRGGADVMQGGAGNDTYVVDNVGDYAHGEEVGGGNDTVFSSVSYGLLANFENLIFTGTADLNGAGNSGANTLIGNAGANVLNGGAGADRMRGGSGDDIYVVDDAGDIVVETGGLAGGTDKIKASVSFDLSNTPDVEELLLLGTGAIDARGNADDNVLVGNAGNNRIASGLGNDKLTGGAGSDTFVFETALGDTNTDKITDFTHGVDQIGLSGAIFSALSGGTLSADAFKDVGATGATVDASDRILYDSNTGTLSYDADGAGGTKAVAFALLSSKPAINHSDFFVFA